jgi:hypothetical protein
MKELDNQKGDPRRRDMNVKFEGAYQQRRAIDMCVWAYVVHAGEVHSKG